MRQLNAFVTLMLFLSKVDYVLPAQVGTVTQIQLSEAQDPAAWLAFQSSLNYTQILPNQQVLNADGLSFNNLNWFSVSVGGELQILLRLQFRCLEADFQSVYLALPFGQVSMLVQSEGIWQVEPTARHQLKLLAFCCAGENQPTARQVSSLRSDDPPKNAPLPNLVGTLMMVGEMSAQVVIPILDSNRCKIAILNFRALQDGCIPALLWPMVLCTAGETIGTMSWGIRR